MRNNTLLMRNIVVNRSRTPAVSVVFANNFEMERIERLADDGLAFPRPLMNTHFELGEMCSPKHGTLHILDMSAFHG